MSFLRTFFSTRPARNQLKQSGIVKERVFGCDLGEHLLNSGHDVPLVLKSCAEVIERHGIVDGIYRLSGITSNIQKLRVAFDEDHVPDLEATYLQDIHSISSLLKMYFRELPNPLLTYQLYEKFAEAVKDEDNKLLRIHDVVQQLPPPHYRTTEYLMRHLARVASHGLETGMHSKNLAIVWAPNLLRSKELELGGGAAALQGVGIQAVVTECLICYCDIIFSDKMPSYSSPHLQKSQKKPRPKSLAISTPTRLLSLEEARERAFFGNLTHSQRYIDVGGGPSSLPNTYHTVIDLPGYRKKPSKENKDSNKGKKSPVGGWKSIFSKPRSGSVKKARKTSIQGDDVSLGSAPRKALTEEDVHNWKKRLRSAKSAESLLSVNPSSRSSTGSHASSLLTSPDGYLRSREEFLQPYHKRSLSSDASAVHHHQSHSASSYSADVPTDVNPDGQTSPTSSHQSRAERRTDLPRRQSFVRGDSTRKALHRRVPSAPSTPRLERDPDRMTGRGVNGQQRAASQTGLDSLPQSPASDFSQLTTPTLDSSLGIDIDAAINARLQQMAAQTRIARTSHSSPASPDIPAHADRHRPPRHDSSLSSEDPVMTVELHASPNTRRRADSTPNQTKFFVSRYHDYAEILSDDEKDSKEMSEGNAVTGMEDLVDKLEQKLSSAGTMFYLPDSSDNNSASLQVSDGAPAGYSNASTHRTVERVAAAKGSTHVPSTQVVRRRAEWIPSDSTLHNTSMQQTGIPVEFQELVPRLTEGKDATISGSSYPSDGHWQVRPDGGSGSSTQSGMTKCLSVPSDIALSLENITASQSDLLSSVTISELSQSVNSFGAGLQEDSPMREDPRWRRSTSLDSLETESTLCRSLRAINAQMDSAFHQHLDRALQLEEEGYARHAEAAALSPLHISEDNSSFSLVKETHFPATFETTNATSDTCEIKASSTNLARHWDSGSTICGSDKSFEDNLVQNNIHDRNPSQTIPFTASNEVSWQMKYEDDEAVVRQNRVSADNVHLTNNKERWDVGGISAPPVLQRRPSSSSSSSSSDVGEDSDDSFEIVYHAQPVDAPPYAMKLRGKQRAAESLAATRGHDSTDSCGVLTGVHDIQARRSGDFPGDSRQISQDDIPWRQSPLFGEFERQRSENAFVSDLNHGSHHSVTPADRSLQPLHTAQQLPCHIQTSAGLNLDLPGSSRNLQTSPTLSCAPQYSWHSDSEVSTVSSLTDQIHTKTESEKGVDNAESQPLHLMLYHPDEFKVPPAAVGRSSSLSLPQVHVNSDTITEEKAVIKKSSFRKSPTETQIAASCLEPSAEYGQPAWQSLPRDASLCGGMPASCWRQLAKDRTREPVAVVEKEPEKQHLSSGSSHDMSGSWSGFSQSADGGMYLQQAEQDAMEVDNLCNKLVDELHSSCGLLDTPPKSPQSRQQAGPSPYHNVSGAYKSPPESPGRRVQVQTVSEHHVEDSDVRQRVIHVEGYGNVPEEELQNALNAGKEMLMAHASASSPGSRPISSILPAAVLPGKPVTNKATQERRLSASRIPRFHKWTESKDEKRLLSDVMQAESQQSSLSSTSQTMISSYITDSKSCASPGKTREPDINRISSTATSSSSSFSSTSSKVSKIPLSQKMPSPTGSSSSREPQQKVCKGVSTSAVHKISSKSPQTNKSSQSQNPIPKARTSIQKSDVAPPMEEVLEVTRPSVKKRTLISQGKLERGTIVKEVKMDRGGAKLIIEKQPNMKKKIQTVHARKVPHPPRQIAEALDGDGCDSLSVDMSSTGPSDIEHSGMSSQEDEVFSDESLRPKMSCRERGMISRAGGWMHGVPMSPQLERTPTASDPYHQLAASRSSLDDSILQLAAERHDNFIPDWESTGEGGYNTGSLRARRSLKMQSLMELFEKASIVRNMDGGADARSREQSESTSGSTTISACSQEREVDTDDDIFSPPCPRLPISMSHRSRSRERAVRDQSQAYPRRSSPSPSLQHRNSGAGRISETRVSSVGRGKRDSHQKDLSRMEGGRALGRPPRHRSASQSCAYSDSSTSESDNTLYRERTSSLKPMTHKVGHGGDCKTDEKCSEDLSPSSWELLSSKENRQECVQRRGSIKELRQLFEKCLQGGGEDRPENTEMSPPIPVRRFVRTRSVSPALESAVAQVLSTSSMRRSLELPSTSSGNHGDSLIAPQPLRLGPKPFYGSKK